MNSSTNYAMRLIVYLAKQQHIVSSKTLSRVIDVSPRYLLQIGAKLRDAGFISVTHGSSGGYMLIKEPQEVSLYDIIQLIEGNGASHQLIKQTNAEALSEFLILANLCQNIDDSV